MEVRILVYVKLSVRLIEMLQGTSSLAPPCRTAWRRPVADTNSESEQGGFTTDRSNITGFSSMHDSGTGSVTCHLLKKILLTTVQGLPSLGNFQLFPYASCVNDTVDGCTFPKLARSTRYHIESVKASPGYFGLTLDSGIAVQMTTEFHTALYQFKFPASSNDGNSPLILMDLTDLSESRQDNASVSVDPDTGRMTGNGRFLPSFGTGNYVLYFCIDFHGSPVRDSGIWVDGRGSDRVEELKISRGINSGGPLPGGAFVRFTSSNPVRARVGLSFISSEQACSIAESEIPGFDFESTRSSAERAWREKLSVITVSRNMVNTSLLRNFYSGIYRTMVNPQNYTGFVPVVSSDQIWFDSFYWFVPGSVAHAYEAVILTQT